MKKVRHVSIRFDMDQVLARFTDSPLFQSEGEKHYNPPRMYEDGFFSSLPPTNGAIWAVREALQIASIAESYGAVVDVGILTQPVAESAKSYSEKVEWVAKHMPYLLKDMDLTQNKGRLSGENRILIDDSIKWKKPWTEKGGIFIHFDYGDTGLSIHERNTHERREWERIILQLRRGVFFDILNLQICDMGYPLKAAA